jgi:myosin heavy subunit
MGKFEGKRFRVYLDQEAQQRRDEILDHLQRNYDGPSDFVKQKLEEEQALSIEEKIQKLQSEMQEKEEELKKFKQIKREREEQDRLRDKKELLKDKQKKLRKLSGRNGKTEQQIREEVKEEHLENKPDRFSDEEYLEKKSDRIERVVESRLSSSPDLDELVESVQRLQGQVEELNGGREDWFLDLDQEKLEVDA